MKMNNRKKILMLAFSLALASCSHLDDRNGNDSQSERTQPMIESPSEVVQRFWTLSLLGNVSVANDLVSAAPVNYLYWKPGKVDIAVESSSKTRYVPARAGSDGTGAADTRLSDEMFANSVREWVNVLHDSRLSLKSVKGEIIEGDKAEVTIQLTRDDWVAEYEQKVLLRKVGDTWRIIAIWDRIGDRVEGRGN